MPDFHQEIMCDTAEDFLAAITPWTYPIDLQGYVFRGHSNDSYELVPLALRTDSNAILNSLAGATIHSDWTEVESMQVMAEFRTLRDFYRLADSRGLQVPNSPSIRRKLAQTMDHSIAYYSGEWIPEELHEIAALAQHYGLPTRLLDWSYDPYVAAFFAASPRSPHSGYLSIWCLNKDLLAVAGLTGTTSLKFVHPHYSGNPNLAAQSGLFTHWERNIEQLLTRPGLAQEPKIDRTPLDQLIRVEMGGALEGSNILTKFMVSADHAPRIRQFLSKIGYTAGRMFPGYEGVAKSLRDRQHYRQ